MITTGGVVIQGSGTMLQEDSETTDQKGSDLSTTEVKRMAAPLLSKALIPSSAVTGQGWLQDGQRGQNSKEKAHDLDEKPLVTLMSTQCSGPLT